MNITIQESLRGIVRVGVLRLDDISLPEDEGQRLWQVIDTECDALRAAHDGKTVGQVTGIAAARSLYRSIGIDPTKTRPSSEALLRRVIKGKSLYRIHPLVDLFNLVSLLRLTPVGLYDTNKLVGETVVIRKGAPGEGYDGIRKGRVNLSGRFLVADDLGPFGSPTSDSPRTAIEGAVTSALAIFFCPSNLPEDEVTKTVDLAATLAKAHLGARVVLKMAVDH